MAFNFIATHRNLLIDKNVLLQIYLQSQLCLLFQAFQLRIFTFVFLDQLAESFTVQQTQTNCFALDLIEINVSIGDLEIEKLMVKFLHALGKVFYKRIKTLEVFFSELFELNNFAGNFLNCEKRLFVIVGHNFENGLIRGEFELGKQPDLEDEIR